MNHKNDITGEDFVSFLHGLGVETYNKSFDWMFNDPDFSKILRWIYNNLDRNNALYDWEECRYAEIEKKGKLLPLDKLEKEISSIQNEFKGLCLPGDEDGLEDMKFQIHCQKERLIMLEKHEEILKELNLQNEQTKTYLTLEITKLNAAQSQFTEEEAKLSEECIQLVKDVECIETDIVNTISNTLNVYASCGEDKEAAKRFFTFAPLESYGQSQALFKSHFDLFTSKQFIQKQNDNSNDEDLRIALYEAENMEKGLLDAVFAYTETKADLIAQQAILSLISNYNNVHPSQITLCTIEAQSAKQILDQEEAIMDQQLQIAIRNYVEKRTSSIIDVTVKSALVVREQIYKDITFLYEITKEALSIDRILYLALRRELSVLEELTQFASDFRFYQIEERNAVGNRIKSMNDICKEQENVEKKLQASNIILNVLTSIFGIEPTNDVLLPIKLYNELNSHLKQLNDNIYDEYVNKEHDLGQIKQFSRSIQEYVWDGCTKQPNCYNRSVSAMMYALKQEMEKTETKVVSTSVEFRSVKNGDKHNIRKLWQWFLTDQGKLFQLMKSLKN